MTHKKEAQIPHKNDNGNFAQNRQWSIIHKIIASANKIIIAHDHRLVY